MALQHPIKFQQLPHSASGRAFSRKIAASPGHQAAGRPPHAYSSVHHRHIRPRECARLQSIVEKIRCGRPTGVEPWHLGCERSRSPNADRPVRGRCSPARRQLKPTLGRAIDWHRCSLPQRVQLSGRLPASCLQVAEQRRSCPALDGGGQLWLEEGGRFEAAAARVSFRGCQHAARSPVPCLVRRLPVTCSSSRRVLTPISVVTAVTSGLVAKMEAAMLPCSSHLGGCRGSVGQLGGVEAQRLAAHASIWA